MKVLLIIPTFNYTGAYPTYLSNSDLPMGFPYLAAALKRAGHEVLGLNPNNNPDFASAYEMLKAMLHKSLKRESPELIGLGGLCTDYAFLRDAMGLIREECPHTPIVLGGGIITNDWEFAFSALKPDFCIIGEGEEVLVQLAETLETGEHNFEKIPNIGYWHKGEVQFTSRNFDYGDIDHRAFPDYEPFGIRDMLDKFSLVTRQQYRYTREFPRPMTIITARSCPFKCTFCVHQHGIKYRARSIENIIAEIIGLYEQYAFNILLILDELFASNKSRFTAFCKALQRIRKERGMDFDWQFQTHASAGLGADELRLAKASGCTYFSYGIESASPKVLASMNKKTRPEQIKNAIALAHEVGLGFGGNFIFGDIAETHETFFESVDFIFAHCMDIHTNFGIVCPYPGSQLFDHCLKKGIIRDKTEFYENIDRYIINMTAMPGELWVRWIVIFTKIINELTFIEETIAFRFENEPQKEITPLSGNGIYIFGIWAHCPHCHTDIRYRERFHVNSIKSNRASFVTGCPKCHKRIRVKVHADVKKRLMGKDASDRRIFCDGRNAQPDEVRAEIYEAYKAHIMNLIEKKKSRLKEKVLQAPE